MHVEGMAGDIGIGTALKLNDCALVAERNLGKCVGTSITDGETD